jgi:NADPH:quinone reductase
MPIAIRFNTLGGPEVLRTEELEPGKPGPQEVQVRHTAIGVNYIDIYDRTGLYPVTLPSGLVVEPYVELPVGMSIGVGAVSLSPMRARVLRFRTLIATVTPMEKFWVD